MAKDHSKDIEFFSPWLVSSAPNAAGEYRIRCPIHGDRNSSANINFAKGVFRCHKSGCVDGMRIAALKKLIRDRETHVEEAAYDPFGDSHQESQRATHTVSKPSESGVQELSEAKANSFHRALLDDKEKLDAILAARGLDLDTIKNYKIGYESKSRRYIIPVYDEDGRLVNFRKYRLGAGPSSQKMSNEMGYGSPARLYPLAELQEAQDIIICEGEWDALMCIENGLSAVTGTHGVDTWLPDWSPRFTGKNVTIIYDNDQAGRLGANRVKRAVARYAASVRVIEAIAPEDGGDISDYFNKHGGSMRKLLKLIHDTEPYEHSDAPESVINPDEVEEVSLSKVVDSMDSGRNGTPLRFQATITGVKGPTKAVPAKFTASCTVEAGKKCNTCPMFQPHEGEYVGEIKATDLSTVAKFVENGTELWADIVRDYIGANKCNFFGVEVHDMHTAEELYVAASVDSMDPDESDYTHRRVWNIGRDYTTQPNVVANVTGSAWPSPKTSKNEFFCWDLQPAVTSIDSFHMTKELHDELSIFQPLHDEPPLDKLRDIAIDRALSVTGIVGRERMHMAMDLVYHSPLRYMWRGAEVRGWLEMIVVGDTRTGKSLAARRLANFYHLGHVISCENASFAGLIGGNKQTADTWLVQWGEYTLNDRRLVVMDEISGMSHEIIALMSDVRTSGTAQLTKIEHGQTNARVRSIWISNPRTGRNMQEKKVLGIDIIEDVIGNPEDIARFDIAMSVRETDVDPSAINRTFTLGEPRYDQHASQQLVLWAWSRRPDQVVFSESAVDRVYKNATKMANTFVFSPGLIQMGSAHEKVSRLAAAVAARLFSTDESGECIMVKPEHVDAACSFLYRLFSYDNFGYKSRSDRILRNREIAKDNRTHIRRWLRENPSVLEFLLDRTASFRSQDLEEMAHLDRDEVRMTLRVLSEAKMIRKDKSQIILEPELQDLLQRGFK
jgi:hypothetical protein